MEDTIYGGGGGVPNLVKILFQKDTCLGGIIANEGSWSVFASSPFRCRTGVEFENKIQRNLFQ